MSLQQFFGTDGAFGWSSYELLLKQPGLALLEIDPQLGAGQEGRDGDRDSCRANTGLIAQ